MPTADELLVADDLLDWDDEEASLQYQRDLDNSERILRKLKRTLKPKIWQAVEYDLNGHSCLALGIVPHSEVKGRKQKGSDWHGQSTAMRHVYSNVSYCSYSDSYGGNVYLRLSKDRYLMMFIHG